MIKDKENDNQWLHSIIKTYHFFTMSEGIVRRDIPNTLDW